MSKGKTKPPIDPFNIFLHARRFEESASQLTNPYGFPAAVLYAFSLELHFKCLFAIRHPTMPIPMGHKLIPLYKLLEACDQNDLEKFTSEFVAKSQAIISKSSHYGLQFDLMAILQRCNNLFDNSRYFHEHGVHEKDAFGKAGPYGIEAVTDAARRVVLEICPEWRPRAIKSRVELP